mmetsp:Transcript_51988/g.113005  ORF Transcript_51988/g.113005 Transcript_51988/m.113005 type:complete len:83 (+) Transcript_51988:1032-1280(+)|eukprot:CAMPEP_0175853550 /NCGR_PEP_ID=MMETSP0107_2-20121207/26870_1 /TAXON_ID=195067 ORGANISM="Goniomonas pacifica, Strain CCMP1869" /NCGR_SAMPLE_ID=MMETSP0107_2 /ASSEMBLY_ACC=CAM_ASM_000203 /LENGTH=82 /DNA_ID=CAMNT_0017169287 /DNA_START=242 /DNA_END=490 /DNA_ORIENTATION=-
MGAHCGVARRHRASYVVPHVSVDLPWFANDWIFECVQMGVDAKAAQQVELGDGSTHCRQVLEAVGWNLEAAKAVIDKIPYSS